MLFRSALVNEAEQDVLRTDVGVVQQARFFLRQYHHSTGPICESFEHETKCTGGVSGLLIGQISQLFSEKSGIPGELFGVDSVPFAADDARVETGKM